MKKVCKRFFYIFGRRIMKRAWFKKKKSYVPINDSLILQDDGSGIMYEDSLGSVCWDDNDNYDNRGEDNEEEWILQIHNYIFFSIIGISVE